VSGWTKKENHFVDDLPVTSLSFNLHLTTMPSAVVRAAEGDRLKRKRPSNDDLDEESRDAPVFKQKVLILSSRGITHRMRHLMNDLAVLMPQSKKGKYCFMPGVERDSDCGSRRCKARYKTSTLHAQRARRAVFMQQLAFLRSETERGSLSLGGQGTQWSKRPLPPPQRPHYG
jgi:hypothetical protein